MKRLLVILLALALLLACVPTPTEEVVLNKTEGRLEAAITETTPVPTYGTEQGNEPAEPDSVPTDAAPVETLKSMLGVPERVQEQFSGKVYGGTLDVRVDAETHVPNVSTVPVDEVAIRSFTPEETERIIRALLGDGPYYQYDYARISKARSTVELQRGMQRIEAYREKVYGDACDVYEQLIADQEYMTQNMLSIVQDMPEPGERQPWTGRVSDPMFALVNADDDYLTYQHGVFVYEKHPVFETEGVGDADKWIADAGTILDSLGNAATAAFFSAEHRDERDRKRFRSERGTDEDILNTVFLPTYHGIPAYDYTTYAGTDTAKDAAGVNTQYTPTYEQERILVDFESGVVSHLQWNSPTQLVSTVNENVALLPFEQVMDTFRTQILYHHFLDPAKHGEPDPTYWMVVTDIRFSYFRMKKADSDTYYLVPVWDFMGYGYDEVFPDDPDGREWYAHQSFLTINAIDGSIIDRNLGY
jgi:hypothetical protein